MTFTQKLQVLLENAVKQVAGEIGFVLPDNLQVKLERPRDPKHGDWATNIAMQLAKKMGLTPRELANKIILLVKDDELVKSASVAGPGFMNFFLSSSWIGETISAVLEQRNNWGKCNIGQGKKVQVEFVSANPTGPLHMGHGRGAAVGDITANILDFAGYQVSREYYINDAGLQMELLGRSVRSRYFAHFDKETLAPFPEDGYQEDYITEVGHTLFNYKGTIQEYEGCVGGCNIAKFAKLNKVNISSAKEMFDGVRKNNPIACSLFNEWLNILSSFIDEEERIITIETNNYYTYATLEEANKYLYDNFTSSMRAKAFHLFGTPF